MKAINLAETKDYISKYETDAYQPTVWQLGCVDQLAFSLLEDFSTEFEIDPKAPADAKAKTVFNVNRKKLDLVRLGLKGFKNFLHPETEKEIQFDTVATARFGGTRNVVSDGILKTIPGVVLDELAQEIERMNRLSEGERKNS